MPLEVHSLAGPQAPGLSLAKLMGCSDDQPQSNSIKRLCTSILSRHRNSWTFYWSVKEYPSVPPSQSPARFSNLHLQAELSVSRPMVVLLLSAQVQLANAGFICNFSSSKIRTHSHVWESCGRPCSMVVRPTSRKSPKARDLRLCPALRRQ